VVESTLLAGGPAKKRWKFRGHISRTGRSRICSCVHHGPAWSCDIYVCMCGDGVPPIRTHRSTCCGLIPQYDQSNQRRLDSRYHSCAKSTKFSNGTKNSKFSIFLPGPRGGGGGCRRKRGEMGPKWAGNRVARDQSDAGRVPTGSCSRRRCFDLELKHPQADSHPSGEPPY
jgi:hypothetical protein